MKSDYSTTRSPRFSLWLASLAAAGLLPVGAARLASQTTDTWNGGTGNWSDNTLWSNGVPDSASADVFIDGGKTATASVVNLDSDRTVGRLTLDAGDTFYLAHDLSVTNSGGFTGAGSIRNGGTVDLYQPGGSAGTLSISGNVSLSGGGTVFVGGASTIGGNGTLTNVDNLIQGGDNGQNGGVGNSTLTIVNQAGGTILANNSTVQLTLRPGPGGLTNQGLLEASSNATLVLTNSGPYTNTGGTISALTGSTVQLSSASVTGGTLSTAGTGVILASVSSALTNVSNTGLLEVNGTTAVGGTLKNSGTVDLYQPGGSAGTLSISGSVSLSGGGTVNVGGASTIGGNGTLTNVDNLIQGGDNGGGGGLGNGTLTIVNQVGGVILANNPNAVLFLRPGTGGLMNQGQLEASGGATMMLINSGPYTNNGTFYVGSGSTFTIAAGALTNFSGTTLTGGTYTVQSSSASNPATLSFGGGSIVTNNAFVQLVGAGAVFNEINALAAVGSNGTLLLSNHDFTTVGALTNAGNINVITSTLTVSGTLNNSGQTQVSSNGNVTVQGNVTNSGLINSQATFTAQGTLISSGRLFSGYSQSPGTIVATGALTQTASGTLFGNGSITAPTFSLAGSLRPGDIVDVGQPFLASVGTLTLNGQVELTGNTTLVFDLAGTAASDEIEVNGALTLEGTLNVNALAGFGAGRYDLIDYTGTLTNDGLALGRTALRLRLLHRHEHGRAGGPRGHQRRAGAFDLGCRARWLRRVAGLPTSSLACMRCYK